MLVEVVVRRDVEGVGFTFAESDLGLLRIVDVQNSSLNLRAGDALWSISGQGLRGLSRTDVENKLDAIAQGETFTLLVGRTPSADELENYDGPTKEQLRKKIWDKLEKEDIADFPRPCHHRIPNFKGSNGACDRLLSFPPFVSAKVVKINPDKPQERARFHTLQQRKKLLVPTPRLRSGLFNDIQPPEGASTELLKKCCKAQGVKDYGIPLPLESKIWVDLVVIGSVAVSTRGFRIGKGEGFADMEWAMMASTGAVGPETVIVTVVHDEQVVDIPEFLVDSHDMTVDFILTPTRVITCGERLPRPVGILWEKLSWERIKEIPILSIILDMEKTLGKEITLKDGGIEKRGGGRGSGRGRGSARGNQSRGGGNDGSLCFRCNSPGHWARECPHQTEGESVTRGGGATGLNRTIRGGRGRGRGRGFFGGDEARGGGRGTGGYNRDPRCYSCNGTGHFARDCSNVT